jgi:hemerythrin-like metal-binding protein
MADYFKFDFNLIGLGVAEMDREHQTLISKMNELYRVHSEGRPFDEVSKKLIDLKSYTVQHFKDEEKYMESIGFEGLESHVRFHVTEPPNFSNRSHRSVSDVRFN